MESLSEVITHVQNLHMSHKYTAAMALMVDETSTLSHREWMGVSVKTASLLLPDCYSSETFFLPFVAFGIE